MTTSSVQHVLSELDHSDDALERARHAVLLAMLDIVPFDGWTPMALRRAGGDAQVSAGLSLLFPAGISDALNAFADMNDKVMLSAMDDGAFAELKIREKVTEAVWRRLAGFEKHREAVRRAAATLLVPPYSFIAPELVWRSADRIWRAIGATDTDLNYYSKRMILSAVLTTTTTRWLADDSEGFAATRTFLESRIENVMGFEKAKAQVANLNLDPGAGFRDTVLPWLARLRYPGRI